MDDTLVDQQLLSEYVTECVQRVDRIERGLLAIESGDGELESGLLRELHFLETISASIGFTEIADLAQQMEGHLASRDGSDDSEIEVETLLRACDYFRVHASAVSEGVAAPPVPRLDALGGSPTSPQRTADHRESTNRRGNRRFLDDVLDVHVCLKCEAKVRDESFGGICVELSEAIPLRQNQELELIYKGHPMKAFVRWSRTEPGGENLVGLEWK